MSRPELALSQGARDALINANTQSGNLPQGTPDLVVLELKEAGFIARTSMSTRGRAARGRLLTDALESL